MRTNKRKPLDSATLTRAWAKVFDSMAVDDLDAYKAEGWMSAECLMEKTGATICSARAQLKRLSSLGRLETKKIRVMTGGTARHINIYRPQS